DSPRVHKQGKGGNDINRFHALSFPDCDDYEECFPSLPGANTRAPLKGSSTAVKVSAAFRGVTTPIGGYDLVEEGCRLERMTVVALNGARKGRSPLNQDEISHLENWLARYRASIAQGVPSVGSKVSKKEMELVIAKPAQSEVPVVHIARNLSSGGNVKEEKAGFEEEQISGEDEAKVEVERASESVAKAEAGSHLVKADLSITDEAVNKVRDEVVTSEEGPETEDGALEEGEDEDDEAEYDEDSSSGGEDAGVDDNSRDEDPTETKQRIVESVWVKESKFEVMSKGLNSAFHVFDQMSKPFCPAIEILESAEGVANAIPPNPKVLDGVSTTSSIIGST
ncbi:hypothetical protein U1Q18_040307, partial [Sarracenia purpurea var. burkii]